MPVLARKRVHGETLWAMKHTIRLLAANDIEFALRQTVREGWDTTAEVFRLCLAHDPHGCFVAESGSERVAMITTTSYANAAWIGNLIVPPEHRYKGIGASMMQHAMAHLADVGTRTIRLEADPPGVKLYRRLGFIDDFECLRFELNPIDSAAAGAQSDRNVADIKTFQTTDMPAVTRFDADCFGDDRSRLLKLMLEDAIAAYVSRSLDRVDGYAIVQSSAVGLRIGPWVASDQEQAAELLNAVMRDFVDTKLVVGVPSPTVDAVVLLESLGFTRTPSCLRMVYGQHAVAGRPERIYGIANGAMG
jgi:ribosomal protein S18 acetylase RimI-like enzyme